MKPTITPLFLHLREHEFIFLDPDGQANMRLAPTGGCTIAFEYVPEENTVKYAYAFCNPIDRFNKKIGRVKAAGRLKSKRYARELPISEDTLLKDVIHELKERVYGERLQSDSSSRYFLF